MKRNELREFVLFLYRNATFPELFFENVSAKDIIRENKLEVSEEELKEAIEYVKKQLESKK
jgi:hypothetical protein